MICSDMHLRHTCPVWRNPESDWYDVMYRMFQELDYVLEILKVGSRPSLMIAGDVFDRWDNPSQLVYFAVENFKNLETQILAIPGQHDLPYHSDGSMHMSSFGVLQRAGIIEYPKRREIRIGNNVFHFYGWNDKLVKRFKRMSNQNLTHICLVHRYVWMKNCTIPNAPEDGHVSHVYKKVGQPDFLFTGDNHVGFWHKETGTFNCGAMFRTSKDQIDYQPRIAILFDNGRVVPYYLSIEKDVHMTVEDADTIQKAVNELNDADFSDFAFELRNMGRDGLNYKAAVRKSMLIRNMKKKVVDIIEEVLEEAT